VKKSIAKVRSVSKPVKVKDAGLKKKAGKKTSLKTVKKQTTKTVTTQKTSKKAVKKKAVVKRSLRVRRGAGKTKISTRAVLKSRRETRYKRGIQAMDISATFKLGVGEITAILIRGDDEIETHTIEQSGLIRFADVKSNDGISITGVCSGTAEIVTNRLTQPVSDPANPRRFEEQTILDILVVI
jgi:hypothetical protein